MSAGGRNKHNRQWANIDGSFDHPVNARFQDDLQAPHGVANIPFVVIDCRLNDHRRIDVGRDVLEQDADRLVEAGRCTGVGDEANGQTDEPHPKKACCGVDCNLHARLYEHKSHFATLGQIRACRASN